MTELYLKKVNGALYPDDTESAELLFNMKQGHVIKAKISSPRNYEFHKKYFALLDHAYESWEPEIPEKYQGMNIEKNRETFRKNIQILAGYGDPVINLRNEVKYESKSISFGKMEAEDFEKLYNSVLNMILKHVLTKYTKDDLERVVEEILRFG